MSSEWLPVLTDQMVDEWRQSGLALLASRVRLGTTPKILGPDAVGAAEVRVWRQPLSPTVLAFAEKALTLPSGLVRRRFMDFFNPIDSFCLQNGALQGVGSLSVSMEGLFDRLVTSLEHPALPEPHRRDFATHVLTSLEMLLKVTPYTSLVLEDVHSSYRQAAHGPTHVDRVPTALMHFTNPGTPYPLRLTDRAIDNPVRWRVEAGDINFHGNGVEHAFSAKRSDKNGWAPRICLSFSAYREGPA